MKLMLTNINDVGAFFVIVISFLGNISESEKKQLDALEQVNEKATQAVLVEERNKRKARADVSGNLPFYLAKFNSA